MKNNRRLILMSLFIAISYIGALIKIPGPFTTIALDSFPGYLGGLIIGGIYGGFVGMIAHLFVALLSGFPFSLPVHIIISFMMFISVFCYSKLSKRYNIILGSAIGVLLNGILMPLALIPLILTPLASMLPPFMDKVFFISLIPILTIASVTNIILSNVMYASIKNLIPLWINE
ncbi:MAG: ECF transporter S component [Acidaminobacteraceae bacterium]